MKVAGLRERAWRLRSVLALFVDDSIGVVDMAPTLARWLQIAPPQASEGKPLPMRAP